MHMQNHAVHTDLLMCTDVEQELLVVLRVGSNKRREAVEDFSDCTQVLQLDILRGGILFGDTLQALHGSASGALIIKNKLKRRREIFMYILQEPLCSEQEGGARTSVAVRLDEAAAEMTHSSLFSASRASTSRSLTTAENSYQT
jgi:hypothetical protein